MGRSRGNEDRDAAAVSGLVDGLDDVPPARRDLPAGSGLPAVDQKAGARRVDLIPRGRPATGPDQTPSAPAYPVGAHAQARRWPTFPPGRARVTSTEVTLAGSFSTSRAPWRSRSRRATARSVDSTPERSSEPTTTMPFGVRPSIVAAGARRPRRRPSSRSPRHPPRRWPRSWTSSEPVAAEHPLDLGADAGRAVLEPPDDGRHRCGAGGHGRLQPHRDARPGDDGSPRIFADGGGVPECVAVGTASAADLAEALPAASTATTAMAWVDPSGEAVDVRLCVGGLHGQGAVDEHAVARHATGGGRRRGGRRRADVARVVPRWPCTGTRCRRRARPPRRGRSRRSSRRRNHAVGNGGARVVDGVLIRGGPRRSRRPSLSLAAPWPSRRPPSSSAASAGSRSRR